MEIDITEDERNQVEYLETPVKSENDLMKYRVIRLRNGLTALLISDEEKGYDENENKDDTSNENNEEDSPSVKQAKRDELTVECCLDVGVGRFSNPPEVPDIAHFVEYMVSRGNEKYEYENDFIEFINQHGGCMNSVTDYEHTTFYFALGGIQKKHLLSAFDRFAQFFIKPLMKKRVIMQMIKTVKEELALSLTYDIPRKNRLLSSFTSIGNPINKYSWRYFATLGINVDDNKIDKLYDELHNFRERHYSAHRMKLVIQATLPLDTLEKYVTTYFADIPSNWLSPDDFTEFKNHIPFDTPAFRKMYKIKPVKDINQLHITWAMPSLLNLYKSKPHNYISWIIKHKGEGSLISYLRKKQWSFDFLRDNPEDDFEHNSIYTLFNIIIDLSYEGQQHLSEILNAIFSFINLLKREGPQKRIYDEIYKITENNFRLLGNNDYIDCLCKNMHLYPSRDYITGKQNYFEYDPEAIQKCLDYLVPETANIMIFSKNIDLNRLYEFDLWTGTKYVSITIPKEWIERWKSIEPLPDFHLPLSNTLLTSDISLLSIPVETPKYPVKLSNNHLLEIWYLPKFSWPKCYINLHFIYPLGLQSPKIAAFMEIYCRILKVLGEELVPSTEIVYDVSVSEKGITIEINGINKELPLFLMAIAHNMVASSILINESLFELGKMQQLEKYYNKFVKPEKLIKNLQLWILKEDVYYTDIDTYIALRDINFKEFLKLVNSFTDHLYIQCLVQGNMTQDAAIETIREYVELMHYNPLPIRMIPQIRITQILLGTSYCKLKNINKVDTNSVVTNYYQADVMSIELAVLIDLIIMIMQEPLKNQLCIEEQLSDRIACVRRDDNGILGFSVTIHFEADKYTTEYVDQRIEEFLKLFSKMLEEFPEEEFNIVKETLIIRELKHCAGVGFLKNEVDRNWSEIIKRQYMFDRFEKRTLAIKDIKINKLREWFAMHTLNGSNFRKLSIHMVGADLKESEVRKANNYAFEVTKTIKIKKLVVDTAVDCEKVQNFVLEYIIDDQQRNKTQDCYITNIEDYKKNLFLYPCIEKKINLIFL